MSECPTTITLLDSPAVILHLYCLYLRLPEVTNLDIGGEFKHVPENEQFNIVKNLKLSTQ